MKTCYQIQPWGLIVGVAAILGSSIAGCGPSEYQVTRVEGRVLCNGEPVPAGFVFLTPIDDPEATGRPTGFAGKSGVGVVQPDGTFVASTYKDRDGALIGPHRIRFEFLELPESEEEWSELEPDEAARLRRMREVPCRASADITEFTVVAGNNELTINLEGR